jgi:hypothetical protein
VLTWVLGVAGYFVALRLLKGAPIGQAPSLETTEEEKVDLNGVWVSAPSEQITTR